MPPRAGGTTLPSARTALLLVLLLLSADAVLAGRRRRGAAPAAGAADDNPNEGNDASTPERGGRGGRRGSGAGPVLPAPPMPAAPADFVAGPHVLGIPMVLPSGPGPPRHGTSADEVHRESLRDLFALELALGQLGGDASRVLNNVQQACSGCAGVAEARLTFAAGRAVAELLERAVNELHTLRRSLQRSRARRNLPPALAFEESSLRQPVNRGPVPPALQPHPDVVMPRCLRYHTPVWDALIWRFVNHVEPTGCSQQANLLRNYPPYLHTHAAPLDPLVQAPLALSSALQTLSLQSAAVAAAVSDVLPNIPEAPVSSDALTGVDAAEASMSEDEELTSDSAGFDPLDYFHAGEEEDEEEYAPDTDDFNASAAFAR